METAEDAAERYAQWYGNEIKEKGQGDEMSEKIYKMNAAEGIFYPAFDQYLCDDSQVDIDCGKIIRNWDSLAFSGGSCFTVHWSGEVVLGAYDYFQCFLGFPGDARMTVTGIVDGHKTVLTKGAAGAENPIELKGKLPSHGTDSVLTDLYLELQSSSSANVVVLSWLGLLMSGMESEAEKAVPVWKEEWEQEIRKGCPGTLEKNMVIDEAEGERIKKLVSGDEKLREFFRNRAEEGMKIDRRSIMREYAPTGDYRFVRMKDRGRAVLEGPILNLAISGWLLEEPAYSMQAAGLILALTAMKWCEGPICDLEGSGFHHVCFREDHLLTEVVLAMGFLGGIFTEGAQRRIADKVEAAWKMVCKKNSEPGYRNFMNQGVVGCRGAMLGALYLQKERGGYEKEIEAVYRRHTRLVNTYLTEEGHCAEGGGYFEYAFTTSILLWHTYAKYSRKSVKEAVPEVFFRAGRYQEAVMSVNSRTGERIPVNCCASRKVSTLLLVFMTLVCDFPEGNNYLIARLEGEEEAGGENAFDRLFYLYYREQINPRPYYRSQEEEIALSRSGLLAYRKGETKLLVGAERNPYTGHFHEDRGLVVLEAEGETLLPDLGTTGYANPASLLMDKQAYHNIAFPSDMRMLVESEAGMKAAAAAAYPITEDLTVEDMATPEAEILFHEITEDGYRFAIETGMLFGRGIKGIREGVLSGRRLELVDNWQFPEEHSLTVTFLSYAPWKIGEDGYRAFSGRKTLLVDTLNEAHFVQEEGMRDCAGRHVYILRVVTQKAATQRVTSSITWTAGELLEKNSGRENRIVLQEMLDEGGTVRIEKPGTYEVEDTLYIKSNTHLILGKGVVLKRSATSVGSFFLINRGAFTGIQDENITVEGLELITNGVEARRHVAVYGLTGEVCFFRIAHLKVLDFVCKDLPRLSYGLHICTFRDIILEGLHVEGRKDAVHLGTGKGFVIRHGIFRTYDDPVALNAHDYAVANPQMGWIEDGLIEDCYDLTDEDTTGYFCRILAGSWCDWKEGMEIQNSDTVVSNGRLYRAFQKPDGAIYKSMTAPCHTEGMQTLDGINWVMSQDSVVYNCGCRNLHFKDIHLKKRREVALSIHFDHDAYSRSVYPGSVMPVQENIIFENLTVQNDTECLMRSITPVDTVKIVNSVIGTKENGNSRIRLETLPGQEGNYGKTHILLQGNTCYGDPESAVECETGRECAVTSLGNLNLGEPFVRE